MIDVPPRTRFFRIIDTARAPVRADRSAAGTLPARAVRHCDAVTAASAFGYYVFPPMDFSLLWDGEAVFWSYAGTDRWLPLVAAQFPGLAARFDAAAPEEARGAAPPFLTALPEPGVVQLWTGLFARTAPGWSLLVRPLANLPGSGGFALYEGIVETDRWFGPLFTNLRLTRTDAPVHLRADYPLLQVQPLPHAAYEDAALASCSMADGPEAMQSDDWDAYVHAVVAPNANPDRPAGSYAAVARRRRHRACPFSSA